MGIIKRGILGGFSGSVGGVVGGSWKGIAYMRAKPLSVANPKTASQVGQRTKFSVIQAIASLLLVSFIKPCWDRFAQQMSGYNDFIKQNIDAISTTGVVTWANLKLSVGSLTGAAISSVVNDPGQNLQVNWVDNSGSGSALATDQVYVAAYNEEQDVWVTSSGQVTRSAGTVTLDFPSGIVQPSTTHVYLSFRRPDGTQVSNSSYFLDVV